MSLVLALDPGTIQTAWVMYDSAGRKVVEHGYEKNDDVRVRLLTLCPVTFPVASMAIEMFQGYGMPVGAEVFEACVWTGRFIEAWASRARTWRTVFRKEVKLHLCGNFRAKDGNIRQALLDALGPQGTKRAPGPTYGISGDVWSALAVAVTAAETSKPVAEAAQDARG